MKSFRLSPPVAILLGACSPTFTTEPDRERPSAPLELAVDAEIVSISQANVHATFSEPVAAAAICTRRADPAEIHLLESAAAEEHVFRFAGLLADDVYDCVVAPTEGQVPGVGVEVRTPPPPGRLPSADVIRDPELQMTGDYTVLVSRAECDGGGSNAIIVLDPEGNNRWRYALPRDTNIGIEVALDGKDRFLWGGGKSASGAARVVDVRDGEVWKLDFPGAGDVDFHHDVRRIPDGRILTLEEQSPDGWRASRLRISDPETGKTDWLWEVETGIEEGWLWQGDEGSSDPQHANWADVVQTHTETTALVSFCYTNTLVALDVWDDELAWTFGPGGDFALLDARGNPLPDAQFPQCPHGLQFDGTDLLVYDNGRERDFTRAAEFRLDPVAMTATLRWDWRDEGYQELYHGSTEWLDESHDRVLVSEGNNDCGEYSDRHSQIVEVEKWSGKTVHRLVMKDVGDWLYRAHRIDGCSLFADTRYCASLDQRLAELAPIFTR